MSFVTEKWNRKNKDEIQLVFIFIKLNDFRQSLPCLYGQYLQQKTNDPKIMLSCRKNENIIKK